MMSVDALEAIYEEAPARSVPEGSFRGVHLARLSTPGAVKPFNRITQYVGFELLPFGIDFSTRRWFFLNESVQLGRFEARPARSRWRPTEAIGLHYGVSRLPRAITSRLYDEVKPLSESLCLGLGGIDGEVGEGDHFFFALTR